MALAQKKIEKSFDSIFDGFSEGFFRGQQTDTCLRLVKDMDSIPATWFEENGFVVKKMAVLGGYTLQPILSLLRGFLWKSRIHVKCLDLEFGIFEQAILSRDERVKEFQPDVIYFGVGSDHLGEDLKSEIGRWKDLWKEATEFLNCDIIQNTFEEPAYRVFGNLESQTNASRTSFVQNLNRSLLENAPNNVHFFDVNHLAGYYGRKSWRDESLYDLSKIPVAYDFQPIYGEHLAAVCRAMFGKSKKCLVLDLDNTLWGGIVGEVGAEGISIESESPLGQSYRRFQSYVKSLKERGVILAICSKNEEANARRAFDRKEMILKWDDFVCKKINWNPKSENIVAISRTLNIGLDSIVFVDDDPRERELVRTMCREVTVPDLSADAADYTRVLCETLCFEPIKITDEDLLKTQTYLQNANREELRGKTVDYHTFLTALKMNATVRPFDKVHFSRIAQLINKTNQFNLTTKRYTESDIECFAADPKVITRFVKLRDRFGDNGLISVFIGKYDDKKREMKIDTWLMSCRVLKKNVEHLLLREVIDDVLRRGGTSIRGVYIPTEKNVIVAKLYEEFGFVLDRKSENAEEWVFDLLDNGKKDAILKRNIPIVKEE